jgi:hypothetical protein
MMVLQSWIKLNKAKDKDKDKDEWVKLKLKWNEMKWNEMKWIKRLKLKLKEVTYQKFNNLLPSRVKNG